MASEKSMEQARCLSEIIESLEGNDIGIIAEALDQAYQEGVNVGEMQMRIAQLKREIPIKPCALTSQGIITK